MRAHKHTTTMAGTHRARTNDATPHGSKGALKYSTIGSLFNMHSFYANAASNDTVARTKFDLSDRANWRAVEVELLGGVPREPPATLLPPTLDGPAEEIGLEASLRLMIAKYRLENDGLTTEWDDTLSYLLSPALASLEAEKIAGTSGGFGNKEFRSGLSNHVSPGSSFRGYPLGFNHCNKERIFAAMLASEGASSCLSSRGVLGLRTTVDVYPDNFVAVWVMIASVSQ